MSGAPRVRSMNVADSEPRAVLVPGGNKAKATAVARKPVTKLSRKVESTEVVEEGEKRDQRSVVDVRALTSSLSAPSMLRRHDVLLMSNLSLNASCSSDASSDSFCSRASTGRIGRVSVTSKRKPGVLKKDKGEVKLEKSVSDSAILVSPGEVVSGKRKCAWVTPNTEPCYVAFHDEEWGIPVHDDRKLFELLILSGALAELTWPVILSKRHIFREVFLDFDPVAVSKLNEKKLVAPGSAAISLLSEPKIRAIIENARQVVKIIEEHGSFDKYCWSFVNQKPIVNKFRYPRQVPVKTPKADVISKDLIRRGFRSVSPTVIYSFMQTAGLTNDHLVPCFRFEECTKTSQCNGNENVIANNQQSRQKVEDQSSISQDLDAHIDLELSRAVDELSIL